MKIFKKILNGVFWGVIICFVVVFGTITFKAVDPFHTGYVNTDFMGLQPYIIQTGSMSGTFEAGDCVFAKVIKDASEVEVGDIVSYSVGDPLDHVIVIHRVIDKTDDGMYAFQGDANPDPDMALVSEDQLLAEYMFHVDKLGYVMQFVGQYRLPIFLAVLALVILSTVFEKDDEEKNDEVKGKDNVIEDVEVEVVDSEDETQEGDEDAKND